MPASTSLHSSSISRSLVSTSLVVAILFGIDKFLGLARQVVVGRFYGLSAELDAYNAANNLPDTIYAVISGGALAMALVPALTAALEEEGRRAAWDLFSRVANLIFTFTGSVAALLVIFAVPLVRYVVVPSFSAEQQALTASLMQLNVIALLIFSLSGLVSGGLHANQQFLFPALAPALYNLGQIVGVVYLGPRWGIYGLALGVILGAMLHLGVQVPLLWRYGFHWLPTLDWRHPAVQRIAALIAPRMVTVAAIQSIFIFTDRLASGLETGAITALAYGWLIMQLPETILGTAVGTVLLPTLAKLAAHNDRVAVRQLLRRAVGSLLVLTIPLTMMGILLLPAAVQLVFAGRKFTTAGVVLVTLAAQMFLLGLAGHSVVEIAARAFYAHQQVRPPLGAALLTAILFIALSSALVPLWGYVGIALANSLAFTLEALLLLYLLRRRQWL